MFAIAVGSTTIVGIIGIINYSYRRVDQVEPVRTINPSLIRSITNFNHSTLKKTDIKTVSTTYENCLHTALKKKFKSFDA